MTFWPSKRIQIIYTTCRREDNQDNQDNLLPHVGEVSQETQGQAMTVLEQAGHKLKLSLYTSH